MADGNFQVAIQSFCQPLYFHLFGLLGRERVIFLPAHFRGIYCRVGSAKPDPHFPVEPPGMVRLIDGEYLPFFFLCQAEKPLDVLELVHVFSLVKQDFTVGIVDDGLLHDRGTDDVIHLLGYLY